MSEKEDLEARIKAIEEKLTPSPGKMSTMKASNRLKQTLDKMKGEKESQEDVVWKLIDQAAKVPGLEFRIKELENEIERRKPQGDKN